MSKARVAPSCSIRISSVRFLSFIQIREGHAKESWFWGNYNFAREKRLGLIFISTCYSRNGDGYILFCLMMNDVLVSQQDNRCGCTNKLNNDVQRDWDHTRRTAPLS